MRPAPSGWGPSSHLTAVQHNQGPNESELGGGGSTGQAWSTPAYNYHGPQAVDTSRVLTAPPARRRSVFSGHRPAP